MCVFSYYPECALVRHSLWKEKKLLKLNRMQLTQCQCSLFENEKTKNCLHEKIEITHLLVRILTQTNLNCWMLFRWCNDLQEFFDVLYVVIFDNSFAIYWLWQINKWISTLYSTLKQVTVEITLEFFSVNCVYVFGYWDCLHSITVLVEWVMRNFIFVLSRVNKSVLFEHFIRPNI